MDVVLIDNRKQPTCHETFYYCLDRLIGLQKEEKNWTIHRDDRLLRSFESSTRYNRREAHRTRYLRLAKKYHPDKNKDPGAHEKFIEIQLAYEILTDPEAKRLFEMTRDSDGDGYSKSNFSKFSEAYSEAVAAVEKEAARARDEAKSRREGWEKELAKDKEQLRIQQKEFEKWKQGVFAYFELVIDKLNKMEDCQAKADILLGLQQRMKELQKDVDNAIQQTLHMKNNTVGTTKVLARARK